MRDYRENLQLKVNRLNAGLAPEDNCLEHARQTARLRNDPNYVAKWKTFHKENGGYDD